MVDQAIPLQTGRDICREVGLIIEQATPLQTGRDIDSKASLLTVPFTNHQAGLNIQGEAKLIIPLQMGRDTSSGGDQIRDAMVLPPQTAPCIVQEGTLPNVHQLHLPGEGLIGQGAPLLLISIALGAGDTTSRQVAECGGNHHHLGILHSNRIVFVVVTTIQALSVPSMHSTEEHRARDVTCNMPPRATRSVGVGLPTEINNRWVAMYNTIRQRLSHLMRYLLLKISTTIL